MTAVTFPDFTPSPTDANDGDQLYVLARRFESSVSGSVTGVRWRVPDTLSGDNHYILLYALGGGAPLASKLITATPGGYQDLLFTAPVAIAANTEYRIGVLTNHYDFTSGFSFPETSGVLSSAAFVFHTATADTPVYPDQTTALHYHLGPIVEIAESGAGAASRFLPLLRAFG